MAIGIVARFSIFCGSVGHKFIICKIGNIAIANQNHIATVTAIAAI
jgi:hypothetical protein